jgi:hypothetical protein
MGYAALKMEVTAPVKSPRRAMKKGKAPHPADDLSFIRSRKPHGTGIDYWVTSPATPGSDAYTADCEAGKALAKEYLRYIGAHPTVGNGSLLACIVHDMMDQAKAGQEWTGIHCTFLTEVNRCAMTMASKALTAKPTLLADQVLLDLCTAWKVNFQRWSTWSAGDDNEAFDAFGRDQVEPLFEQIAKTPATTLAGVQAKAEVLRMDSASDWSFEPGSSVDLFTAALCNELVALGSGRV